MFTNLIASINRIAYLCSPTYADLIAEQRRLEREELAADSTPIGWEHPMNQH